MTTPTGTCAHCGDPIRRERLEGDRTRWVHQFTGKELCELDRWETAEPAIAPSHQGDARPLSIDSKRARGRSYHPARRRRR
jgi:hypothetical protein